ncbi:hypothetical protein [Leptospira adleri]|uniref:hypothetical protein n=1 Tax=Leptospira adleri TaxID=2023186 RepID=UPI001083CA0E|nr:hypothetical protein [Leptospira adleri]TGM58572.1 hypothetical protein EHQ97_05600 [Leptospira adleri]
MDPIVIGHRAANLPTADAFLVVDDPAGLFRFDVYFRELAMPPKAWRWDSVFIISGGPYLSLFNIANANLITVPIDAYVTAIYAQARQLFVSTASEVLCFDDNLDLIESYHNLGIDGVTIENVTNDSIAGAGEWDPPGGWRTFKIQRKPLDSTRGGGIA